MEDLHRERIYNNLTLLAERTQWNCALEEKLLTYKIFNLKMVEDLKKVRILSTSLKLYKEHIILR